MDPSTPDNTTKYTPSPSEGPAFVSNSDDDDDVVVNLDVPEIEESRLDYMKRVIPSPKPTRIWPKIAVVILITLMIVGGAGYFVLKQHGHMKNHPRTLATVKSTPSKSVTNTSTMAHYVSNGTDLNLSFDYPNSWSVTPDSNNNTSDSIITLNSPLTTVIDSTGASVTGKVTVTIRPGSMAISELANGAVTAAQSSVQFSYTNPTSSQDTYPFLSFFNLTGESDPSSAFSEVLVTGKTQFTKDQSILPASVAVDPIIAASFYHCTSSDCFGSAAVPLTITQTSWQNVSLFEQTMAILASMQLH